MNEQRVVFYCPDENKRNTWLTASEAEQSNIYPDTDDIWLGYTYKLFKKAGIQVVLSCVVPREGILVYDAWQTRRVFAQLNSNRRPVLVCIRADREAQPYADFELVQNSRYSDGVFKHAIPHWVQPDIVPRDETRSDVVKTIVYKGDGGNLHPMFFSDSWNRFVHDHDLEWLLQSHHDSRHTACAGWGDFSGVDVSVALRPELNQLHEKKPASKLVNSWKAGIPAILGPEYAYRDLRRSDLDYLEVSSLEEVKQAVLMLKNDRNRYRAMIDNGKKRAVEFSDEQILNRWVEVLFDVIPKVAASPVYRRKRMIPCQARFIIYRSLWRLGLPEWWA